MSLVHETDYGTPRSKAPKTVTLDHRRPGRDGARRHFDHAGGHGDGHADPEALCHRHGRCLRLLPALPRRDRGPCRHAGLLHHTGRRRHGGAHPHRPLEAPAQGSDGALHLRPSPGLPDLCRQWRLRAAGHGRRRRPARRALRLCRRQASQSREGRVQPLFHLRPVEMHRLLALRARLRGGAGDLRADHRRARVRVRGVAGHGGILPRFGVRVVRRLRSGVPDRDAHGKVGDRDRPARAFGGDDLRLLRRRLCIQGGDARRRGRAHDALQGRQGQSRPFLREGPLCLGLHHPPRTHPEADDPRRHRRSLARGVLGRGDRAHRLRIQAHPGEIRPPLHRRHHVVTLHQRGNVPGAEADPRRLRQQQCRYLRAGLPLADRLRAEHDVRNLGRHPGLRFRRADRRRGPDRRQSDRRPSRVRLAHEEAPAPGREADRDRSAPHRSRAYAPCGGGVSSAAAARHQRGGAHRARPRGRDRGSRRRDLRARALRLGRVPGLGGLRLRSAQQPGGGGEDLRRSRGDDPRRGAALCHRRQRGDLLRARRHRAQPGLDHGDRHRQSRHGDRQYRASRRRRESAARAEQRAGRLRHGFVPA